jgi:glycerophosphoryl diester phosphodiesterase
MVEADVRWTRDEKLVLLHSDTLEATTSARGGVGSFTLRELRSLDAGSHFDSRYADELIPTLEDLLRFAKNRIKVLLDLKAGAHYQRQILSLIEEYRMEYDVVLGVRSDEALREIKDQNPLFRVLSFGHTVEHCYELLEAGSDIMRLWGSWVTQERVNAVRDLGRQVWVMVGKPTAGAVGQTDLDELRGYVQMGVSGVLLDDPRLAIEVNRELHDAGTPQEWG